jgi:hypothetical protein
MFYMEVSALVQCFVHYISETMIYLSKLLKFRFLVRDKGNIFKKILPRRQYSYKVKLVALDLYLLHF